MNITKKHFAKKISNEIEVPAELGNKFINSFFNIQKKFVKSHRIKINKFGSFNTSLTPERVGRNPKTLKEYTIPEKNRISFKASNYIKKFF